MLPDDRRQRLQLSSGHIWVQFGSTGGDRYAVLAPYALVAANEPVTFTLDFDESGGTVRVMEGRVDLSTPSGDYESSAETGQALAATKSGNSIAYPFDVATEQAAWEPLFAVTTTSAPDDTTETTTGDDTTVTTEVTAATLGGTARTIPPADPEARDRFSQWGRVFIVGVAVLFVLLLAAVIILAVLLARRRRQPPTGMSPTYQSGKTMPPSYPPPAAAPYAGPAPEAPPAAPAQTLTPGNAPSAAIAARHSQLKDVSAAPVGRKPGSARLGRAGDHPRSVIASRYLPP